MLSDITYPTGQKYSLELMFAKFATAKIALESMPGARCLKTTLLRSNILFNGYPDWYSGSTKYRSNAHPSELPRHKCNSPKTLKWIAKHWAHEYTEKTTPLWIFMPCNLSSCKVFDANCFTKELDPWLYCKHDNDTM